MICLFSLLISSIEDVTRSWPLLPVTRENLQLVVLCKGMHCFVPRVIFQIPVSGGEIILSALLACRPILFPPRYQGGSAGRHSLHHLFLRKLRTTWSFQAFQISSSPYWGMLKSRISLFVSETTSMFSPSGERAALEGVKLPRGIVFRYAIAYVSSWMENTCMFLLPLHRT